MDCIISVSFRYTFSLVDEPLRTSYPPLSCLLLSPRWRSNKLQSRPAPIPSNGQTQEQFTSLEPLECTDQSRTRVPATQRPRPKAPLMHKSLDTGPDLQPNAPLLVGFETFYAIQAPTVLKWSRSNFNRAVSKTVGLTGYRLLFRPPPGNIICMGF